MRSALVAALAALLTVPAVADATLVFQKGVEKTSIWVAEDDGSNPRKLVAGGALPRITPDGTAALYVAGANGRRPSLREIPIAGGDSKLVVDRWRFGVVAISPDSRYVAALSGPEIGKTQLTLVDRTTGRVTDVDARGLIAGASFSPDSKQLVYSRANKERVFVKANLKVAGVDGSAPEAITTDNRSLYPVWGPERIAYVRYSRPEGKKPDGPKFQIHLLDPDGGNRTRLTRKKVRYLLSGLVPRAWSQSGAQLLAQFGGQDTTYPVTVDPETGAQDVVGTRRRAIEATALSRDGTTILGYTGAFTGDIDLQDVVTVPYGGGAPTVIVKRAAYPDWDR